MAVWTSFPLSFFFNRISFRIMDSHSVYHIALLHRDCFLSKKISILEYQGALLPSIIFPLVDGCSRIDNRWTLKIRSIELLSRKSQFQQRREWSELRISRIERKACMVDSVRFSRNTSMSPRHKRLSQHDTKAVHVRTSGNTYLTEIGLRSD